MLTAVIQAGGESRRMGQDKGLLPFLGRPLILRVISRLQIVADEMIITTNRSEAYQFLGLPLVSDIIPGKGALGGLFTALSVASHELVAVVACDMPFINSELVLLEKETLIKTNSNLVVPHSGEGLEPFHAVYQRSACLPAIEAALQSEKWRVDSWFNQVKVQILPVELVQRYDPGLRCFKNVNTPEELQAAEELARRTNPSNDAHLSDRA